MGLAEILQWLQYSRKTGLIMFERQTVVKKIFVEQGMIVAASSNDPREYLGQILVFFGYLTENELAAAFQQQKKAKKLLGKVLKEDFKIPEKAILDSLKIKIEETIYDLFLWEDGRFVYSEGLSGLGENDRLETSMPIEHVIFEGARRVDEWREFRKQFPNDKVVFARSAETPDFKKLGKDPILKKIYEEFDGKKNLERIFLDTHAPEYRGYESVAKLFWGGFIKPDSKTVKDMPAPKADLQNDLMTAAELYKAKKFDESYDLLENFLANKPDHAEAQTLFGVVRDAFLKYLYSISEPNSVPELTMDFTQLNEQIYSSKEGYLASRVNGEWDVKSLIMISPLGEMESLRILKRLYDGGMLQFKGSKK